jgi:hypothetical protein
MNFSAERTSIYDINISMTGEEYMALLDALSTATVGLDAPLDPDSPAHFQLLKLRQHLSNHWGGK